MTWSICTISWSWRWGDAKGIRGSYRSKHETNLLLGSVKIGVAERLDHEQ